MYNEIYRYSLRDLCNIENIKLNIKNNVIINVY